MKKTKLIRTIFAAIVIQTSSHVYAGELSPGLSERLQLIQHKEHISVIVRMADQADLNVAIKGIMGRNKAIRSRNVIRALQSTAAIRQKDIIAFLKKEKSFGNVVDYIPFWIFNGFTLQAIPEVIRNSNSTANLVSN